MFLLSYRFELGFAHRVLVYTMVSGALDSASDELHDVGRHQTALYAQTNRIKYYIQPKNGR